ncbi:MULTISPECIES: rifamycin-inactivating phosphotransferase [Saccharothrix]|uniref:rifamycin-inactivating phosphotransferase n=1 Tax=Saccharothrix TaxID=2071 RepID=UPI00093CDE32|nr:rifamycin-inactivating phosphotransferase [Saccharothrix sp. CB00851]OKI32509.1 phosphoenolpyruvate synthase [Saccharothrix sp. CB00851]
MSRYVLGLHEVDRTEVAVVGGKGAHLGELTRIEGVRVPPGFCVTTDAFRRVVGDAKSIGPEIRRTIEDIGIPDDIAEEITAALSRLDARAAYAVRSSATAEDLPGASFAGQQDSYLNVVGAEAILRHVSRCWASLFTERAIAYREHHGFDHDQVHMAVVVQQMVFPRAAGVLFTADPVTSNRKVATVEATFGLGEALVSGLVTPDSFKVRDDEVVAKTLATEEPALTDAQVLRLVRLGRRVEAHFGRPQDIEWCLVDDDFHLVQSRPITTLFPVPDAADQENHVYVSVGHQQMMTDAMRPLGLSLWGMTAPMPRVEAGGRLFVDVTQVLASPRGRNDLIGVLAKSDPLIGDALQTVVERDGFLPPPSDDGPVRPIPGAAPTTIETDPTIVTELIARGEASNTTAKRDIEGKTGPELLDFIVADLDELRRFLFDPQSYEAIMAGMQSAWWLNEHLLEWLGEKNAADTLTQSVPHNVTSEMGLELLDVADAIRPHPEVVAFLQDVEDDDFLNRLPALPGGQQARDAIVAYLDKYGMRCIGEIDITRPRWRERPTTLLPMILTNIKTFAPGSAQHRFDQGLLEAQKKEQETLAGLRALPDGDRKAEETERQIARVRTFTGYREYPKYFLINRYSTYKQALLTEADRLVRADVLTDREDIFYLTLPELQDLVRTNRADHDLIRNRKEAFKSHQALTPPRVLTSDGEAITGSYRRDNLPTGALIGLPVSVGTVEGRARVILDLADADLEPGDILVTAHTDPSWSPLFVAIAGLVTEVGGQMTHGAVIAREYGLPAIVGVERATQLIQDGQRIRLNGTDGYLELLT